MGTKKILSLCLAALMLFGLVLPASAAGTLTIEAAAVTGVGTAGTKINVAVSATENPGFVCGDLIVTYPADVFELTLITFVGDMGKNGGTKITGQTAEDDEGGYGKVTKGVPDIETPGTYRVSVGYDQWKEDYTQTGTLFTLEFTVKDGAALKSYDIGLSAEADSFLKNDASKQEGVAAIAVNVQGGSIELQEAPPFIYGDVDGNKKVNKQDSLLLKKYLAGWDVQIDENGADVDGNKKVNKQDSLLLKKYLAGWDVKLGK